MSPNFHKMRVFFNNKKIENAYEKECIIFKNKKLYDFAKKSKVIVRFFRYCSSKYFNFFPFNIQLKEF